MIKKGTMRLYKFLIGVYLAIIGINSFINIPIISDIAGFLTKIPYLTPIIMIIASYFLIITGRQL